MFKRCSIGTKAPNVCQESIPHTIASPAPAWTTETKWDDPYFHVDYIKLWPYHLNVTAEIETNQTRQPISNILLFNFGEPKQWIVASVSSS